MKNDRYFLHELVGEFTIKSARARSDDDDERLSDDGGRGCGGMWRNRSTRTPKINAEKLIMFRRSSRECVFFFGEGATTHICERETMKWKVMHVSKISSSHPPLSSVFVDFIALKIFRVNFHVLNRRSLCRYIVSMMTFLHGLAPNELWTTI